MMSKSIKVLSFDLDDTLWPCTPTILRAEELLYQWLMVNVPVIPRHYNLYQLRDKRLLLVDRYPELACDLTKIRIKSFELLAEEFSLSEQWIKPAFQIFYEARQQVILFDDVRQVLDDLVNKFQLVSLTNGNADPVKTGIAHWFDYSINAASIGKLKSEPDIYHQVLKLTHIEAQQMVHIGDDPLHDIRSAKSAGVFAIWLNREKKPWLLEDCVPDAEICDLFELSETVSKLG